MIYSAHAVWERLAAFVGTPFFRRNPDDTVIATTTSIRGETVPLTLGDLRYVLPILDERAAEENAQAQASDGGAHGE